MKYEPHRLRKVFQSLRRPFDYKFNNAIDQILLVLGPFEELEKWVAEIEKRVKGLEDGQEMYGSKGPQNPEGRKDKGQEAN